MSAMTLIEHIEVGSGGNTEIEFASIPDTHTDLLLVFSIRLSNNNSATLRESLGIRINDNSGSTRYLYGNGSTATSGTLSSTDIWVGEVNSNNSTASTFSSGSIYIPNYNSAVAKSISSEVVFENNATEGWQYMTAGLSTDTGAITSITIRNFGGEANIPIVQYSSATLFGITAGSDGTTTVS